MNISEILTTAFYTWELQGRGWHYGTEPYELEPPFHYYNHFDYIPEANPIDDDKPKTIFNRITDFFTKEKEVEEPFDPLSVVLHPTEYIPLKVSNSLIELQLYIPHDEPISMEVMHEFVLILSGCEYHLCFEIIGAKNSITFQLVCDSKDETFVTSNIKIFLPQALVTRRENHLITLFEHEKETYSLGCHFSLADEFMRPLQTDIKHVVDPLSSIYALFEGLQDGELGMLQIMFKGTVNPWSQSIINAVTDGSGNDFFQDDPSMRTLAEEKISAPLFGASIRGYAQCGSFERSQNLLNNIANSLTKVDRLGSNSLVPIESEAYDLEQLIFDVFNRTTHFSPMLLNSYELVNLAHLPIQYIPSKKLYGEIRKTKELPKECVGTEYILGYNSHLGITNPISLTHQARLRHIHVIGATGSGKTNLIKNLIVQDFEHGLGITVLDPHGDLIDDLIGYIPEHRIQDVILIDPADLEYPIGLNLLSAHSEIERIVLESDLVSVFKRQATSWGDQMTSVLSNAINAFLESSRGGTLVDLRRFLTDTAFRNDFLKTVEDETVLHFWNQEFKLLRSNSIASILTRLDTFLRPKIIRYMMMQKKGLNFDEIINGNKILLVKLSQGLIGEANSHLLGTLFIAKLNQASQARQQLDSSERKPFYLYIDEFQNFITDSMTSILSGARKYGLGLILAHQDMEQLLAKDREVANSVLSNPYTRICFRSGDTDARKLESGFSYFEASDIQNLKIGEAIIRIGKSEHDGIIDVPLIETKAKETTNSIKQKVVTNTRENYSNHLKKLKSKDNTSNKDTVIHQDFTINKSEDSEIETPLTQTIVEPIDQKSKLEASKADFLKQEEEKAVIRKHKSLQLLAKKLGQERGFKSTLELPTKDNLGKVDVGLIRDDFSIAIEISVTNSIQYEVKNIQKCLDDDYDVVIIISDSELHLSNIKKEAEKAISIKELKKCIFINPNDVSKVFDSFQTRETNRDNIVKGYRVKIDYSKAIQNSSSIKYI